MIMTIFFYVGFAAIKLTALGRPQLLLQLSEVIHRARKYHQEVTGVKGSVIEGHVDPQMFENRQENCGHLYIYFFYIIFKY